MEYHRGNTGEGERLNPGYSDESFSNYVSREFIVEREHGLHIRPISMFVKISSKYPADITVKKGEKKANGKSMMHMLSLAARKGEVVEVHLQRVDGIDPDNVYSWLEPLFKEDGDILNEDPYQIDFSAPRYPR